jgi:hypothetical protein
MLTAVFKALVNAFAKVLRLVILLESLILLRACCRGHLNVKALLRPLILLERVMALLRLLILHLRVKYADVC